MGLGDSGAQRQPDAAATIGTAAVLGDVNWVAVGSAAVLAGALSLLTSVAGLPELTDTDEEG